MQKIQSHTSTQSVKQNFLNGYPEEVHYRFNKLETWQALQGQNCDEQTIYKAIEVSRAALFRWKKQYKEEGLEGLKILSKKPHKIRDAVKQKQICEYVLKIRQKYPIFGKEKIKIMLKQEMGIEATVSTIGRVISKLIKQGKIQHVHDVCGKRIRIQRRQFEGHAKRFQYGMQAKELGEMIQVDHMTEGTFKHFAAICPISKLIFTYAYRQATALTSVDFLEKMILFFPFKLLSIQVDGGSEFMAEFEKACKKHDIKLFVLPPRSPKLNGCIERSNGTFHYEFYVLYPRFNNIHDLNEKLAKFSRFYNEKRPHQRLNYLTPLGYLNSRWVKNDTF